MPSTHQPLLDTQKPSHSHKTIYAILALVAILCSISLVTIHLTTITSTNTLQSHNLCRNAHDQPSCESIVAQLAPTEKINHVDLLQLLLKSTTPHIFNTIETARDASNRINNPRDQAVLRDCVELLDLSIDRINSSITALQHLTTNSHNDAHTWLSSVLTNYVTCLDGLDGSIKTTMETKINEIIQKARTSLAIMVRIKPSKIDNFVTLKNGKFPSWLNIKDRKLLALNAKAVKANVVVAKDGSGNFKTVKEAVASVPDNGKSRFVIYVKKGVYKENVEIGKKKTNVMLIGDGMGSTVITGSLNYDDGTGTFQTATVAAVGDGFIAQDLWFQNSAGPQKHQAVALRVGADKSVINRCKIDAYQDTLYAHSNRQFYIQSYITGTIDFIFGNAAVVLQNCKLVVRMPMKSQSNMVTAQARTDPNQNTGTSIQKCDIISSSDLEPNKRSIKSYLGRPWRKYSRTVVMQSNIGDLIDPAGWSIWDGDFALNTLYYGEYMNKGPGAGTSERVKWPGYRIITSASEAMKFTVAQLIQGGVWLKSTGVAYTEGL